MGINKKLIDRLNKIILNNLKPDLVFLNVVNKKNLTQRLNLRRKKNRYDLFNYNFYKKVQNGYLKLAKNKNKYFLVDSNISIYENKLKIINKIKKIL